MANKNKSRRDMRNPNSNSAPVTTPAATSATPKVADNTRNRRLAILVGIVVLLLLALVLLAFLIAGLNNNNQNPQTTVSETTTSSVSTSSSSTGSTTSSVASTPAPSASTSSSSSSTSSSSSSNNGTPATSSTSTNAPTSYTIVAGKGENVSWMARRAIKAFVADRSLTITREERLAFEVLIANQTNSKIKPGQSRTWSADTLQSVYNQVRTLTAAQHQSWLRRANSVRFV